MTEPFVGQITIYSFNFAPKGWALCNGQPMSIPQNQALFSLIGTTFGGNGIQTFNLPNMQGRTPLSFSNNGSFEMGQAAGEQTHTLLYPELPVHNHALNANTSGTLGTDPGSSSLGPVQKLYGPGPVNTILLPTCVGMTGGNQPHQNMQPYLVLNFCIALNGIFPTRS